MALSLMMLAHFALRIQVDCESWGGGGVLLMKATPLIEVLQLFLLLQQIWYNDSETKFTICHTSVRP